MFGCESDYCSFFTVLVVVFGYLCL